MVIEDRLNIITIDVEMGGHKNTCAVYLVGSNEYALIETGTANSAEKGLKKILALPNFDRSKVKYIIPTHIHLDHAGGTGLYTEAFPNAEVLHHAETIKHLIDPERIYSSTIRTDSLMAEIFGKPKPVNEERIYPVKAKEIISIDEIELEIVDSPGHHTAHYAVLERESNSLFTGDSAGWYWQELDLVLPTTPPPKYDPSVYKATLNKFLSMDLKSLYFTHYGRSNEVERLINGLLQTVDFWFETILKIRKESPKMIPEEAMAYLIENYYQDFKDYPIDLLKMGLQVPIQGIWLYQEKNIKNLHLGIGHQ